ncbi:hypothetical protein As57867_019997, partial [Aphanomyces stellatus]
MVSQNRYFQLHLGHLTYGKPIHANIAHQAKKVGWDGIDDEHLNKKARNIVSDSGLTKNNACWNCTSSSKESQPPIHATRKPEPTKPSGTICLTYDNCIDASTFKTQRGHLNSLSNSPHPTLLQALMVAFRYIIAALLATDMVAGQYDYTTTTTRPRTTRQPRTTKHKFTTYQPKYTTTATPVTTTATPLTTTATPVTTTATPVTTTTVVPATTSKAPTTTTATPVTTTATPLTTTATPVTTTATPVTTTTVVPATTSKAPTTTTATPVTTTATPLTTTATPVTTTATPVTTTATPVTTTTVVPATT